MGRPLRRHEPGQLYLVTTRCHQARFFLRPDPQINEAVLEWLTRAQQHFPRLQILAVCVLSNHLHLVVRDQDGELAAWASYFLGHLARAINRIRKRRGACFERRYSAEPILDDGALLDRLIYVIVNPVKAGLSKSASKWPGVVIFASKKAPEEIAVSWVDRDAYRFARRTARLRGEPTPNSAPFRVRGQFFVGPFDRADESTSPGDEITAGIEARERELGEERRRAGRRTLSRKQVLAQSWRAAPRRPNRSPRPLCHTSDLGLLKKFSEGYREFVSLFREASELLRGGDRNASFPDWCFPPGRPLVRAAGVGTVSYGAG